LAAEASALGLDFLAVTEHNCVDTHQAWDQAVGKDLLIIRGQEITTDTGHWLALGLAAGQRVEWQYGIRDNALAQHLAAVRDVGGLCVAAHPHAPYPSGTLMYPFDAFELVEVWNGLWSSNLPWNADNDAALAEWGRSLAAGIHRGSWQPAIGNSDAHLAGQLGRPHNVVLADDLTTAAVLAGLRDGRSWLADSTTVELSFDIAAGDRIAGIGDRLLAHDESATARLSISGVPSGSVSFHTERGMAYRTSLPASGSASIEWCFAATGTGFARAEVRYDDGTMAAMTNPVLVEHTPTELAAP
jgi:hypothetical protein